MAFGPSHLPQKPCSKCRKWHFYRIQNFFCRYPQTPPCALVLKSSGSTPDLSNVLVLELCGLYLASSFCPCAFHASLVYLAKHYNKMKLKYLLFGEGNKETLPVCCK